MSWSARQYTSFEAERTRPVRDLASAIPTASVRRAVDIGCGPGNSTEVLAERFPGAEVSGLDSSPDMIEAARQRLPGIRFDLADIAAWDDSGPFDVILSNAALQWLPNHETLMPRLAAKLAEGGSLAVQIPDNLDEPAHRLMREVAADGPWAAKLVNAAASRAPRLPAAWYYTLLRPHAA
ncbi:MAG TPA: methyltransferase domain-containing protein, partial [Rhodopila sp.]